MSLDQISEQRLQPLYPPFAAKVRAMADDLETQGVIIRVTQALRTDAEQNHLFAMGRTIESNAACHHKGERNPRPIGSCKEHPLGAPVTNAKAGFGNHPMGIAVDVVPDNPDQPGFQPDWVDQSLWDKIMNTGEKYGLRSGRSWHDQPHFEDPAFPTVPTQAMRDALESGGLPAVWALAKPAQGAAAGG